MKTRIRFVFQQAGVLWAALALLCSSPAFAQATNDDCAGAVSLTVSSVCTVPVNGTVAGATQSLAPTAACGAGLTNAADVWYQFTASATSHLVTLAPRFAAILDVRSGTCTSSTSIFCTTIANNNTSAVSVGGLSSGQTYFIRVYPATNTPPTGISSTFALCIGQGATGPNNDDCAGALNVPVNTGACANTVSADNTQATASAGVPAPPCANYQGRDLWFSVIIPASGTVTVQTVTATTGNDVGDTGISLYSGTCSNLVPLGCDDDGAGNLKSLLSVTGRTPGEVIYIRAWSYNNQNSGTIAVCASNPVPLVNDDCATATALPVTTACTSPVAGSLAGATQSLPPTANCGNSTAATDVWYTFVAGGTTQTLTFTGTFQAVVDVRSGTCANSTSVFCSTAVNAQPITLSGLTSGQTYFLRLYSLLTVQPAFAQFTLCLTPGPIPATNDDCANAVALPVTAACTTPVSGTVVGASQSLPATAACGLGGNANDVWYSFTSSGPTQVLTFTGNFPAVVDVRSGTCANSTSVFCGTTFNGQALIITGLTTGQAYFLRLYANGNLPPLPANSAFTLCLNPGPTPPVNDNCAGAIPVPITTNCVNVVSGTVAGASQSLPPTAACGSGTNAYDVWFSFVAGGTTQTLSFTGNFQAVVDVRSGTCANSTSMLCTTTFTGQSVVIGGLTIGQTYFIRVYGNSVVPPLPNNSAFSLCLMPGPIAAANDDCSAAVAVAVVQGCSTSTNGTVVGASQSLPSNANCGNLPIAADVWYSFVAGGTTQQITLTPRFTAIMDVRSGTCASSTSILCNSIFANSSVATLVGGLTAGQTYFIRIYANGIVQPVPANATFTLCVSPPPPPPANDECTTAVALTVGAAACTSPVNGTIEAASQSLPPTTNCGLSTTAPDVWYRFVATSSAQALTLDSRFAATVDVRTGNCSASTSVTCFTVAANAPAGTSIGGLTAGQTYYVRIYSMNTTQPPAANATFSICISTPPPPPVNDDCAGALNVPVQFGNTCVSQTSADNTNATASAGVPTPGCANYLGRDLWFSVVVPASGTVTVRTVVATTGQDVGDTGMSMYSGTCGSLVLLGCDDDGAGNLKSQLTFTGRTPGEVLYIRVWRYGNTLTGTLAVCATAPTNCATPTALAAATVTSTSAQLSWQPGGTAGTGTTYTVEFGPQGFAIGTGTVLSNLTTATAQLTGLQSGTAYCFYVRQECPGGNGSSAYAGPVCFTTPCALPTGLVATAITPTSALLGWQTAGTPPAGTTFTLEYGPQGFTQGTGTSISGITANSFGVSSLQAGTTYCFYVRQECPGATGGTFAGPACFTTSPASTTCLGPTGLAVSNTTGTTTQLGWQPGGTPASGTTFTVQYGLQGFALGTGVTINSLTSSSLQLTGLAPSTSYCFYVQQNCPGTNGSSAFVGPFCFQTTTSSGTPANDDPCGATTLTITGPGAPVAILTSTNVGATTSAQPGIGAPTCSPSTTPRDVWFVMTPASGVTSATLTLTGAPAGMVRIFTAPNCTSGPFTLISCRSSGANNTGLSTATLTGLVPGTRYYVAVSGYGAADTPGAFTISSSTTITAIRVQAESAALLVYPNPSNTGQLTLKLTNASFGAAHATLLNSLGQVVRTETLRSSSTEQLLSTRGLATGIYTVRVMVGNEVLTRKIVLE